MLINFGLSYLITQIMIAQHVSQSALARAALRIWTGWCVCCGILSNHLQCANCDGEPNFAFTDESHITYPKGLHHKNRKTEA